MQETWVRSLGWEDPLEKEMANYSSILEWRIPWTEEPGGLQSTGSQKVGHDWVTSLLSLLGRASSSLPVSQEGKGKLIEFGESHLLVEFSPDREVLWVEDETHMRAKAGRHQDLCSSTEMRVEMEVGLVLSRRMEKHHQHWSLYRSFHRRWKAVVNSLKCFLLQKTRNYSTGHSPIVCQAPEGWGQDWWWLRYRGQISGYLWGEGQCSEELNIQTIRYKISYKDILYSMGNTVNIL